METTIWAGENQPNKTMVSISCNCMRHLVLLTSADFNALFHISERTAFQWRREGLVPYIQLDKSIYYRLADVLQALEDYTYHPLIQDEHETD